MSNEVNKKDEENQSLIKSEESSNKNLCWIVLLLIALIALNLIYFLFFKKVTLKVLINDKDFIKPLSDERTYRVIQLENLLDVVLISDPKASKSSASMSVGVGSFMDLEEAAGLAHFCEHMLFLGSKSYPRVGEFDDFLVANSGSSNAFTESERTTFYFEIDNKGFNHTLQMFSRMFAEPLFDISYMNREIDAVNSEHEKNLNNDGWRKRQLLRSFAHPGHPQSKFSTGNNVTLRSSGEKLNEYLHTFYNKYYVSSNMKLAVVTNLTIDDIAHKVKLYFSDIKSHQMSKDSNSDKSLYGNIDTLLPAYASEDLGKMIYFKKISTGASLDFYFSHHPVREFYKTKPLDYLDYLISYSGENSLLNFLRKRNYANRIESGFSSSHKTFSIYQISLSLTNEGLAQSELIVRLVFNFLNMVKNKNISQNVYEEIKRIYDVNFNFLEKNDDYSKYLSSISTSMFDYDYIDIVKGDYIHNVYNQTLIQNFLNGLNADNSIIVVGSEKEFKDFVPKEIISANKVKNEKFYNTEYIESALSINYSNALNEYPVKFKEEEKIDPVKSFRIRNPNKYITSLNELIKDCNELKVKCEDEFDVNNIDYTPLILNDEVNLKVFYKIDKTFKVPKNLVVMKILTPTLKNGPKDYLYFTLISNYLEYNLSILLSDPLETGNSISIEEGDDGIQITVNSFSDVTNRIMNSIINEIFKLNPDNFIFNEVVEITSNKLNDVKTSKPIIKNIKVFFKKLLKYKVTTYREVLDLIKKEKPTLENFKLAYENFKKDLLITIFFNGNVEKDEITNIVNLIKPFTSKNQIDLKSKKSSKQRLNSSLEITNSIHLHRRVDHPVTFQIKNEADGEVNHAVSSFYQVGPRDHKKALYLSAMEKCLGQVFYYNLRTVQQLGYIVHAGYTTIDSILYYRIIVQGAKKAPLDIDKAIDEVVLKAAEKISECKEEKFEKVRSAIKERLTKKDDNLKERASRIWREINDGTYEFNRTNDLIKSLEQIDSSTLKIFFENLFINNPAKLTIHNYAANSPTNFVKSSMPYQLNNKVNVNYTDSLDYFSKSEFIYAYKQVFKLRRSSKKNKVSKKYLK
jgi:insulysin